MRSLADEIDPMWGTPRERHPKDHAADPIPLIDPAAWQGQAVPAREWAWADYIPHRQATYLTGPGSAGKSLLGQQLCTSTALGLPFMGKDTRQAVSLYLTCEDDPDELHRRQDAICAAMGVPLSALAGKLYLASLTGATGNALVTFALDGTPVIAESYHALAQTARTMRAGFVTLDNVAHLFGGNENIRHHVAVFVGMLNNLAAEIDGSVLFLGHPNKAGQDFSGSTAWENQVRSRLFMEVPKDKEGNTLDPDARVLVRGKANYARNDERLEFRWHKWAFVRDEDLPPDIRAELSEVIKANAENEAFMRCLAVATASKRAVSHNHGVNYAPAVFAKMTEGKRLSRAAYERAFERLLHLGQIELDARLWQGENRHWKQGIRAVEKCANPPAPTPCADQRQPLGQVIENTCADLRAPTPFISKDITGAAEGHGAPETGDWP